jgi:hypothetical protein
VAETHQVLGERADPGAVVGAHRRDLRQARQIAVGEHGAGPDAGGGPPDLSLETFP